MTTTLTLPPPAIASTPVAAPAPEIEVSVVMPCLNEADTLATCITKAQTALAEHGVVGEVIVADNGSTDGSVAIAERLGARVVHVTEKGYGNALRGGIAASRARFVIMGDADDSYDFLEIPGSSRCSGEAMSSYRDVVCREGAAGSWLVPCPGFIGGSGPLLLADGAHDVRCAGQ